MASKGYIKNVPVYSSIEAAEEFSRAPERAYIHKKPKPFVKKCKNCGKRRVKFHHFVCVHCHKEMHKTLQEKSIENVKEF